MSICRCVVYSVERIGHILTVEDKMTSFEVDQCFMFLQHCINIVELETHISFYPVILSIHAHLCYRDTADNFIAAHRLSDMLVKINLDESASRNQASIAEPPPTQMRSVRGRPSELGMGKNSYLYVLFT